MLFPVMEFFASLPSIPRPFPQDTPSGTGALCRTDPVLAEDALRRAGDGAEAREKFLLAGTKEASVLPPRLPLTGTQGSKYAGC